MFSTIDISGLERALVGGTLAVLAIVVAFGPELHHHLLRLRARGRLAGPVLTGDGARALGVETGAS